eukprot:1932351-Prymnesium_polylepis.1
MVLLPRATALGHACACASTAHRAVLSYMLLPPIGPCCLTCFCRPSGLAVAPSGPAAHWALLAP